MGEMADFLNDNMYDAYEMDNYDDRVSCKYCNRICTWGEHFSPTKGVYGWRLVEWETGKLHKCKKYKHQ